MLKLHYNGDNGYLFLNGKGIYKFKSDNKNVNFATQFCLGSISNKFGAIVSLKISLYNFLVDYNAIDKSNILNIHKYLMPKNNI